PGVQGANFTTSVGSVERVGIIASNATIREVAVWVTGMLVSGVAGTAICADLGARKVRQELDAMAVMGVNVVRRMIAPRVLALTLLMPALGMIAMVACISGNLGAALQFGATPGGFWAVFTHTWTVVDTAAFGLRAVIAVGASGRYFAEILRQCATLLLGSTVILVSMVLILGGECGLFLTYLARPLGATAFSGTLMNPCGIREMFPYMFS